MMWNGKRMNSESSGMSIKKFRRIQKDWGKWKLRKWMEGDSDGEYIEGGEITRSELEKWEITRDKTRFQTKDIITI